MTTSYIPLAQVLAALPSSYDGSDNITIQTYIIPAVCDWADRYLQRASGGLLTQNYDILMDGTGEKIMYLPDVPVQSISRIGTIYQPYMWVRNNDPDLGSRAYFQIVGTVNNMQNPDSQTSSTGITLTYISNAVTTTNTLLWTNYTTINALITAINAVGHNWQAGVMSGVGTASTADLRATQGAFGCRIVTAYAYGWLWEYPAYINNPKTGELYSPMGFPRGKGNFRINYQAGYPTLPNDMAYALAEMVVHVYQARDTNSNMQSENLGGYSYSQLAEKTFDGMSRLAKDSFLKYKRRPVSKFSTFW